VSDRTPTLMLLGISTLACVGLSLSVGTLWAGVLVSFTGAVLSTLVIEAALNGAWLSLLIAQLFLARRGFSPLRMQTFLEAAHEADIMRYSGASYQFKHSSFGNP